MDNSVTASDIIDSKFIKIAQTADCVPDSNNNFEKDERDEIDIHIHDHQDSEDSVFHFRRGTRGDNENGSPKMTVNPAHLVDQFKDIFTSFKRNLDFGSSNPATTSHTSYSTKSGDVFDSFALPMLSLTGSSLDSSSSCGFNLVKFITAGITNQLKALGVEDLECKECVDAWLSHRRQMRWKQSLPLTNLSSFAGEHSAKSLPCIPNLLDFLKADVIKAFSQASPSEPNSSMLRLSGEGNEELSHFLGKMEEVRHHLNNASCTLLQCMVLLMLPYMKLLTANELETPDHHVFIQDWIEIAASMASELRPGEAMKSTKVMISREFNSLSSESKRLYKRLSKLFNKANNLYKENEKSCKKFLGRLHPRSLNFKTRVDRSLESRNIPTSTIAKQVILNESLQFSPIPLYRANITSTQVLMDNLFCSKSKTVGLVVKDDIEKDWEKYADLPFQRRREILLSVLEDLRCTLKSALARTYHIKQLFIEGYPDSVYKISRQNLAYLKKTSKDPSMLVLSKATIANQVKAFLESLARLVRVLRDIHGISKHFHKTIKINNQRYIVSGPGIFLKNQIGSLSSNPARASISLKFDETKPKLMVPFVSSSGLTESQF